MLTVESQRQYIDLGVNNECGGIEVARTEERMEELNRRMTSATAYGIEGYPHVRVIVAGKLVGNDLKALEDALK